MLLTDIIGRKEDEHAGRYDSDQTYNKIAKAVDIRVIQTIVIVRTEYNVLRASVDG